ncbi:unnamed protein product, partial [Ectocarpus sp. 4 AP-2014]
MRTSEVFCIVNVISPKLPNLSTPVHGTWICMNTLVRVGSFSPVYWLFPPLGCRTLCPCPSEHMYGTLRSRSTGSYVRRRLRMRVFVLHPDPRRIVFSTMCCPLSTPCSAKKNVQQEMT